MVVISAGVALVRPGDGTGWELLVVHPGGPYWAGKDEHAWSIPKGEVEDGPDLEPTEARLEATARREFAEELGHPAPDVMGTVLPRLRIGSGKYLVAFLAAGDLDPTTISSETVEIAWPPRSGRTITIPEVDAAAWVTLDEARTRLHKGQVPLVDLVAAALADRPPTPGA
ncbi:MAG: NUDIX domain-containing protein [Acidimicrobiales bacterium]